jgi:hypothetical protein
MCAQRCLTESLIVPWTCFLSVLEVVEHARVILENVCRCDFGAAEVIDADSSYFQPLKLAVHHTLFAETRVYQHPDSRST